MLLLGRQTQRTCQTLSRSTPSTPSRLIATESPGQFDPTLVTAFTAATAQFDEAFGAGGR